MILDLEADERTDASNGEIISSQYMHSQILFRARPNQENFYTLRHANHEEKGIYGYESAQLT